MSADTNYSKSLTNVQFKLSVLDRLNQMRQNNTLCDVIIQVDGQTVPAHKCVLSAASPYFHGLFNNNMQEKQMNIIELQAMSYKVSEGVISYIYSGEIAIDPSNARELVTASDYLLIPSLKHSAADYLETTLSTDNCVSLRDFAVKYNCPALAEAAEQFISENFVALSLTNDFIELCVESVLGLVSRDDIRVTKEEDVFTAVLRWVKHDSLARKPHLPILLDKIRLFSLSKYTLRASLCQEQLIQGDAHSTDLLNKALQMQLFPDSSLDKYVHPRHCLQDTVKAVLLIGGHNSIHVPNPQIYAYDLTNHAWYWIESDIAEPRTRHSATVCEGFVYILAGKHCCHIERFDHRVNAWHSDCLAMDTPIYHAAAVTHKGKILLIGGERSVDDQPVSINIVQEYDPQVNEWKYLASMTCCRAAHVAVCIGDYVYVTGGYEDKNVYCSSERYDTVTNEWTSIADMQNKRHFAAGCALRGKLFIAGGYHAAEWVAYASCEIYDPTTDHWHVVASMPVPRAACGIAQVEDDVLLFGGENGSGLDNKMDCVVHYSAATDTWSRRATMAEPCSCLQACVVHLPRKILKPCGLTPDD